jgi:hypothetical protein
MLSCLFAPEPLDFYRRPAVVMGHPGHELKVFGWIATHHPRVYVLTDGSGQNGVSRLSATENLLAQLGAERGEIFGAATDVEIYEAILEQRVSFFLNILDVLAESFINQSIDFVAGDLSEGFNPTHDLCRELIDAAVALALRARNVSIPNYGFSLTEGESSYAPSHDSDCMHLRLDDDLLRRKLQAARSYAELSGEVQSAIQHYGEEYFGVECLKKNNLAVPPQWAESGKPHYELCGEQRKAEGKYASVIRYREHIVPIMTAIREHAGMPDLKPRNQQSEPSYCRGARL